MATGDDFINENECLENLDSVLLLKDNIGLKDGINWLEIEKEKTDIKEHSEDDSKTNSLKKVEFNLLLDERPREVTGSSTSSSSASSYGGPMIGKYKKLQKPLLGYYKYKPESEEESSNKSTKNFRMMGSIQLGIHLSVGSLASKPERDLLMNDFMVVESTNFAADGSNRTPAHSYSQFVFKTYAPIAFRYFRELFGIPTEDYLLSFCKNALNELPNPGSSGSIFYVTHDDKFVMKTMQNRECDFLQKLLPGYYMNLHQNPKTLLPKFFGLYGYKCESKKIRLVAMNNVLPSHMKLHQKYDLKGSTYKRKANKRSIKEYEIPTYKDLDFLYHYQDGIYLEEEIYYQVMKTIKRDCTVLESFKIIDYSLLLGIRNLDKEKDQDKSPQNCDGKQTNNKNENPNKDTIDKSDNVDTNKPTIYPSLATSSDRKPYDKKISTISLQGGIPAKTSKGDKLMIFIGIIDILQSYRLIKKIEHSWKSLIHNGDTVSVHNPRFYSCRFQRFLVDKVFKKIPSTLKSKSRSTSKIKTLRPV